MIFHGIYHGIIGEEGGLRGWLLDRERRGDWGLRGRSEGGDFGRGEREGGEGAHPATFV